MIKFETVNELSLRITASGGEQVFTKAGAFVGGQCMGQKNFQFEKVLLGPQGNPLQALVGQLGRRFTGENLPLMKVKFGGQAITYYANEQQHIVIYQLRQGETISIESENILAFTPDCRYGIRFLAQGIISQKGLATSTLTGQGPNALVAFLVDGNPLVLQNMQGEFAGTTIEADPDSVVCWIGDDPGMKMDLSWKNLIGQASGESYMFEWSSNKRAMVIIQPEERTSGLDVSMDGRRSGSRPTQQQSISASQSAQDLGGTLNSLGNMLGGGGNSSGGGFFGGGGLFG